MSRRGVLQVDLGVDLLEQLKREAAHIGLSISSYTRLLVKQRRREHLISDVNSARAGKKKS